MSEHKTKNKRSLSDSPSISTVHTGLLDCYDFVSPNEYSEKTFGLFAFLLRKSVGDINFSDIFSEVIECIRLKQPVDLVALLKAKRQNLPEIPASIEKCLMLNRLITYIEDDLVNFEQLISVIHAEMNAQIIDNRLNQMINYPEDFRQRERDFHKRVDAQNVRHVFYYSLIESKAPNLIYLQNQTTEHLSYLIDSKMRYDRHFRDTGFEELKKIFSTSFMVIAQPHSGVNPILICEKKGPGIYKAKVSVIIVSLLHDFNQLHPNMIEFDDIEVTLSPTEKSYRLDESTKLSWKTCELQINPNDRPRMIQYAELTSIVIKQTSSTNTPIHFPENLHSFKFLIKFHLNLNEHKISNPYEISLQSLPFGIVTYNAHIPYALTRVILDEIQRFSQHQLIDVKLISDFILRYFIHRTGVEPKSDLKIYLRQELSKANDEKKNCQSLEEIFMDFLVEFVQQVEFMAKHPILAMLYSEGLFHGPCDSEKAAAVMQQLTNSNSPITGLRFNSIRIDSYAITKNSTKSMRANSCFVRVDIYNPLTKKFQYRTFNAENLMVDIMKFVSTANEANAHCIRILSGLVDRSNPKSYKYFTKYYDDRLHDIHKVDPKYKPIVNLLLHINEVDDSGNQNINGSNLSLNSLRTDSPLTTTTGNHINVSDVTNGYMPVQNGYSPSNQQPHPVLTDQDVIGYVLSKPNLCIEILRKFRELRLSAQQQQASLAMPTQYSSSMQYLPQQIQATSVAMSNQSTTGNFYQYVSINGIQGSPQQHQRQTQYVSISTNNLRSDRAPSESTNDDSHQWVDDFFSSSNSQ